MPVDSPEDLYGLPLDRFIPERAALAKALRSEKRREEASEVAALRKPSIAAWAVNQLVRTQPESVQALFQAGDDLAHAQADATAGKGGGDAMREATHRQRAAVGELVGAAEGLLSSDGHALSQATMDRVSETLRAASVDAETRRQVTGGCLTQELRFAGIGIVGLAPLAAESQPATTPIPAQEKAFSRGDDGGNTKKRARRTTDTARAERAKREAEREREAALSAARDAEAEARRAAARASKELATAQAGREAAVASLEEAEALLSTAARRAEETSAKLKTAAQALTDLDKT